MSRRIVAADAFGHVAVAMGGVAAEREVSLKSGAAVLAALQAAGVQAEGVDWADDPVAVLASGRFDRIFNVVHGRGGEDGQLQALARAYGIPVTGSDVLASALAMDKWRTKLCWQGAGLPTPSWRMLDTPADVQACAAEGIFPLMVKPALEGSSIGMSRVASADALLPAWELARQYDSPVFAERWIHGREYTVAVLDGEALPAIRLETPNAFYDYEAKYLLDSTRYHCPAGLDAGAEATLGALALAACAVIGVRGWGRGDFMQDDAGSFWLIEVNTVPGMTDHSLVPMAARAAGLDFGQLCWRILETTCSGH